jgi:hypothetical protein
MEYLKAPSPAVISAPKAPPKKHIGRSKRALVVVQQPIVPGSLMQQLFPLIPQPDVLGSPVQQLNVSDPDTQEVIVASHQIHTFEPEQGPSSRQAKQKDQSLPTQHAIQDVIDAFTASAFVASGGVRISRDEQVFVKQLACDLLKGKQNVHGRVSWPNVLAASYTASALGSLYGNRTHFLQDKMGIVMQFLQSNHFFEEDW